MNEKLFIVLRKILHNVKNKKYFYGNKHQTRQTAE
jgi:hypothetical protein